MANIDLFEVILATYHEQTERLASSESMPVESSVGSGGATTVYIMEASDSVTDVFYSWLATNTPDYAGSGYPGPNSPVNITVSGKKIST